METMYINGIWSAFVALCQVDCLTQYHIDLLTAGDTDPTGDVPIGGRASAAAPQNQAVIMLMNDVQHRQQNMHFTTHMPMLMHH